MRVGGEIIGSAPTVWTAVAPGRAIFRHAGRNRPTGAFRWRYDALQIRSEALELAVGLALEGRQLVLELRWRHEPAETTLNF